MKLFHNKWIFYAVIILLVYAFATAEKSIVNDKEFQNEVKEKFDKAKIMIKSEGEQGSFLESPANAIIEKIRETDSGAAAIDAIVADKVNKKLSGESFSVYAAQESGEIKKVDLVKGVDAAVSCGDEVNVNYDAYILSNVKIDSTDNKPVSFTIGKGQVIKGLENGVIGMQKGGRRKIAIPSQLAFDDEKFNNDLVSEGQGVIYDVELIDVSRSTQLDNLDCAKDDANLEGR